MSNIKLSGKPTKLPPHGGQFLEFTNNVSFQNTQPRNHNYVYPLNKFVPMMFQPGPVYRGGKAAAIGHQPFNYTVGNSIAYNTPKLMDFSFRQSFRGTQSTASFSLAQQAMAQLLQQRSLNSGR